MDQDGKPSKPVSYRGEEATDVFLNKLQEQKTILFEKNKENVPMELTDEEQLDFVMGARCYVCDEPFTQQDRKVRDHDHTSRDFRGAAHNTCNLKLKPPKHIPVFLHNLSR